MKTVTLWVLTCPCRAAELANLDFQSIRVTPTLGRAGIDITIFKAHSVRGTSTSSAAEAGISIPKALEAADWLI